MKKTKIIEKDTIKAEIYRGKFGQYRYKSPYYGYKIAYKYDTQIVILENDDNQRIIARMPVKYWRMNDIKEYIEKVYNFTLTRDFSNMVNLYHQARELNIDNGYVRELKGRVLNETR